MPVDHNCFLKPDAGVSVVGLSVKEWKEQRALRDEHVLQQAKKTVQLVHIVARRFCNWNEEGYMFAKSLVT